MRFPRLSALIALLLMFSVTAGLALAADFETLTDIETRWSVERARLGTMTRAQRLASARKFFESVSWEQIRYCCGEAYLDAGPDQSEVLRGLVDGKLRSQGVETSIMAGIIADPEANSTCQGALVRFIVSHRDSIAASPGASILGRAFLDLADAGTHPLNVINDLERGAAFLWAGDPILERAMRYARDAEQERSMQGVAILGESRDSRAPDSLVVVVQELDEAKRHPKAIGLAIGTLSLRPELPLFELYDSLFQETRDDSLAILRREALSAMARCGDPRAYEILLREYDDAGTGIVESTHLFQDRRLKSKYYTLWYFVRLAEEGMIIVFNEKRPEAALALELLDRASHFGLPASRERIITALDTWAAGESKERRDRVRAINARFASYYDPASTH